MKNTRFEGLISKEHREEHQTFGGRRWVELRESFTDKTPLQISTLNYLRDKLEIGG